MTRLQQQVKKSQQRMIPCIFCGEDTKQRGLFIDEHKVFGIPKKGTRCVIYAICTEHNTEAAGFNKRVGTALMKKYN